MKLNMEDYLLDLEGRAFHEGGNDWNRVEINISTKDSFTLVCIEDENNQLSVVCTVPWNSPNVSYNAHSRAEYIAACSPKNMLDLIKYVRTLEWKNDDKDDKIGLLKEELNETRAIINYLVEQLMVRADALMAVGNEYIALGGSTQMKHRSPTVYGRTWDELANPDLSPVLSYQQSGD